MFNEDSIMDYTDFNNIENKIKSLRDRLFLMDFNIPIYSKHTWTNADFLLYTYLNHIENGLANLGTYYYRPFGWQNKKTWTKGMSFSYKDVNRWWNNLNLIQNEIIQHTENLKFNNNVYFDNTTIFG